MKFFFEFLRNPFTTGAIARSSPWLAAAMVQAAQLQAGQHVLELGPGDGAFTGHILEAIGPTGNYFGLDFNPTFIAHLQAEFAQGHFCCGDAAQVDLATYTNAHGKFEAVISGLPWAAFPPECQQNILANILPALTPQAIFTTFAYVGIHLKPAGQRFQKVLQQHFQTVTTTSIIWRNLPPAFIYVARGPRII
jgi:phosphatidylethanolamine/phosphatidyl-N-methylethanolamine N-methyltransferase